MFSFYLDSEKIDRDHSKLLELRAFAKENSKSDTNATKGTVGTLKFTTSGEAYDYYGNLGDSSFSTGDVREANRTYLLSLDALT
ncbi:hypothetical protein OS493_015762 [Desmophyllum pertusum]|uniref:Uncharacterized protein n=1 Tax=Desmophyllum pertusum TaxID=174260 RepID=A0A9W9YCF4_9CNID|nr:hypothetical protein OS493_015762 [Desmophyllum pertusum]